jgi:DNA-binding transcriptional regulator YiaG
MNAQAKIKYPAAPLSNVWLKSGFVVSDGAWGPTVRYTNLTGLAAEIFRAVLTKRGRLNGQEVAYLRGKLDITQSDCARTMGVQEQTLSLWERGKHRIPSSVDALLRRICIEDRSTTVLKRGSLPKTLALLELASSINDGEYVGSYEGDHWTVAIESEKAQPQPLQQVHGYVTTFSSLGQAADLETLFGGELLKYEWKVIEGYPAMIERMLPTLEVSTAETSLRKPIKFKTAKFFQMESAEPDPETFMANYMINPATGACFVPLPPSKQKELAK